ncbi:LTA synthase family protein [Veillonella criceti]|uniref:Phosphoglycerol transferase and related proteins, alkaline phosphatase superfamily n=1 Tax=Veillonella criceti TaxID=103891 RepID=A0A380NNJ7_9FIRM|nr:LTA synthase family protein [Veillonella criceti]SUP43896.1 Phosphoglycerol transferase and related proteins, alkaline phosphatase superfamily [Veillonella criceti]
MARFNRFTQGVLQDVKTLGWFIVLFSLFRLVFIVIFSNQLHDSVTMTDWVLTMWYGLRISLKTAGLFMALGFFGITVPYTLWAKWPRQFLRGLLAYGGTLVFTLLFFVRIPYFTIFNSGFNRMLINGVNDDWYAILMTAIDTYGLLWRLPVALVVGAILGWCAWRWIDYQCPRTIHWLQALAPTSKKELIGRTAGILLILAMSAVFLRFGGAFTYSSSINWENAGRFSSQVLNEAVLDDGQALYRVYASEKRLAQAVKLDISETKLKEYIANNGGNPQAKHIDEAFTHTVVTPRLKEQPKTVVLVLGESYALWPFLDTFKGPGDYLVSEGKALAQSSHSLFLQGLAHGTGTMPAVNGYVTGLPSTGLYENYERESYKEKYGFGIAATMKRLGYKTVFWYGGFGAWQDVRNFVLAQNFDEFHDVGSFSQKSGNAWGVPDGVLFKEVETYMAQHKGEKIFHFILTTSNHPPYDIDLEVAGFDTTKVMNTGIKELPDDSKRIVELGHIWYADQMMGQFVKRAQTLDPRTLFVITGDHGERFTFAKEVDRRTNSGIPIIFYGAGIDANWLASEKGVATGFGITNTFASSLQIAPTLAELVGRYGDTYESLVPSIFESTIFVFNHELWLDTAGYHEQKDDLSETYRQKIDELRTIAIWRVKRGNAL